MAEARARARSWLKSDKCIDQLQSRTRKAGMDGRPNCMQTSYLKAESTLKYSMPPGACAIFQPVLLSPRQRDKSRTMQKENAKIRWPSDNFIFQCSRSASKFVAKIPQMEVSSRANRRSMKKCVLVYMSTCERGGSRERQGTGP